MEEDESTSEAESPNKLNSIKNFRDLACPLISGNKISKNLFFRSASLDVATKEDIEELINKYSIRTILDLRAKDDVNTKKGPFTVYPRMRKVRLGARINTAASQLKSHKRRLINRGLASKTIMINFTGKHYRKYVWNQLDNRSRRRLIYYRVFNKDKAAKLVGSQVLDKGGLVGLYCSFIDYSGEAIGLALKVLVSAINYPILIHCAQGKDRTGIVTALALAAIGIDEETIVADYALSTNGLEQIHKEVVEEMADRGLNASFAESPPEVIQATFAHIRQKYGSLERYLDFIGFTVQFRSDLTETLLHGAKDFIDRMQMDKDQKETLTKEMKKEKKKEKKDV